MIDITSEEIIKRPYQPKHSHSLAVVGKTTISEYVGRASNLKKLAVIFA